MVIILFGNLSVNYIFPFWYINVKAMPKILPIVLIQFIGEIL